jgi:hypothetical protein
MILKFAKVIASRRRRRAPLLNSGRSRSLPTHSMPLRSKPGAGLADESAPFAFEASPGVADA